MKIYKEWITNMRPTSQGLYERLLKLYSANEPIIVEDVARTNKSQKSIYTQFCSLCAAGKLKRFARGVYYIPGTGFWSSIGAPPFNKVVDKMYARDSDGQPIGYLTGVMFANTLGLTTQVPAVYEVVSNKATKNKRDRIMGKMKVTIFKPKTKVTLDNYKVLQLLDTVRIANRISDVDESEASSLIQDYIARSEISKAQIREYLPLYSKQTVLNAIQLGIV
jgi:hypothetical protein